MTMSSVTQPKYFCRINEYLNNIMSFRCKIFILVLIIILASVVNIFKLKKCSFTISYMILQILILITTCSLTVINFLLTN